MRFKTKILGVATGGVKIVVIHRIDAFNLGVKPGDRIRVFAVKKSDILHEPGIIAIVDIATNEQLISPGTIGLYDEIGDKIKEITNSSLVEIRKASHPLSFAAIKKKIEGKALSTNEIIEIVRDCAEEKLLNVELAAFIIGVHIRGLNDNEVVDLTHNFAKSGEIFDFGANCYDKHSTGGVPGNKISLIIVPILAASGIFIPKTSTRAITSPSGTADSMEVLANVIFSKEEVLNILEKENAGIFWAGAMNSSPAADGLIEIQKILNIDPLDLMIASILSKKLANGIKKLVLDIPIGAGTKFPTQEKGRKFAFRFKEIAKRVGIESVCVLTSADQPIGHAVGPALEAREALRLLWNPEKGPSSLLNKATDIAGILLEMAGKAPESRGKELALEILNSGRALRKMQAIIKAQGGNPNINPNEIKVGSFMRELKADKGGIVASINNKSINQIAKIAGCPGDQKAGIEIEKKIGAKIHPGDVVFRIYANSQASLNKAVEYYNSHPPIGLGSMTIEKI
ncbi:MAG: AMP phosphorylase [Promethearchaeota archaeon]